MVPLCASRHRTLTRCSIWPLSKKPLPLYLARFCATTFELSLRLWRENELALPESTSANSSVNQITLLGKQCNAWRSRETNFFFSPRKIFQFITTAFIEEELRLPFLAVRHQRLLDSFYRFWPNRSFVWFNC